MGFLKRLFGRGNVPAFVMPADADCEETPSGLKHECVVEGAGDSPGPFETVRVHYAGWLPNGTLFDSSYARGETITFPLNRVIAGWGEGLQLMKVGGTSRFVIPPELGYGARGAPPAIGPNETLVFQVELVDIG